MFFVYEINLSLIVGELQAPQVFTRIIQYPYWDLNLRMPNMRDLAVFLDVKKDVCGILLQSCSGNDKHG